jgi:hypothetical protein
MAAAALFWGSVWGLGEATLGHLLHLVRVPGLPGLVMVPFAVLIMGRAASRSGGPAAVFLAGVVAASFKLFDLAVPGTSVFTLINPAQAILLEALAGAVWVRLFGRALSPEWDRPCLAGSVENQKRPHFLLPGRP